MPIELPPGTAAYSDRNPPPNNRQLLIILGMFVGLVLGIIWLVGLLVNNLVWLIPPAVEQQLGALIVPVYAQQAKPSPTQDTLNQLLDRLEAQLPPEQQEGRDYQVLYIPESTVNAIAIPGDHIIIYQGLLAQTESENELMMVMGHELGHFTNRDHLRGLGRNLLIQLALAAVIGDAGSIQAIATSGLVQLTQSQFSQSQEREADEVGLTLLQKTYGQVAGAKDFFARLSRQPGANIAFLTTHPAPGDRVVWLEQLIKTRNYPVKEKSPLPEQLRVQ